MDRIKDALNLNKTHSAATGKAVTTDGVTGPHNSSILNTVDPRVNTDTDGSRNTRALTTSQTKGTGAGTHLGNHTGITGGTSNSTNAGPHNVSFPLSSITPSHSLNIGTSS
jgi:hypothetical protein